MKDEEYHWFLYSVGFNLFLCCLVKKSYECYANKMLFLYVLEVHRVSFYICRSEALAQRSKCRESL